MRIFFTLLFFLIPFYCLRANTVTDFTGTYRNGQVFFTWTQVSGNNPLYRLYRSGSPITNGSQLAAAEYLGYTDKNSPLNFNLTTHDSTNRYWIIENGGSPLTAQQGLFVTTSVANGNFYYALTAGGSTNEDTEIIPGENSLSTPVAEVISQPQPVLQEIRIIDNKPVEIYGDFMSSKVKFNGPLRIKAGWIGYDFAVYRNNAVTPQGLHIRFHAGGADFLSNITKIHDTELNLGIEDYFPSDESSGWIGTHGNYDPFKKSNNDPPVSGTDFFYTGARIAQTLAWVIANFPVDSNKVWVDGSSFGATGAFVFALLHPSKVAALEVTSGLFNFGFQTDYNPECSMNTGEKNRVSGDEKLGTLATNLLEESGYHAYDLLNGGKTIHDFNELDYPVIYCINGRNDDLLGWSEKPIWYDSVNNNHLGGYYFFDNREHSGNGKRWFGDNFSMYRYSKNVSYPAFSNCSINDDAGNGHGANGDSVGTINGYLDWKEKANDILDNSNNWSVMIFMRDLNQIDEMIAVAPSSCIVDITPRRLQNFSPPVGAQLQWSVMHLNQQVQSGSQTYSGGLITIPGIQVFKDTILFQLNWSSALDTFYKDGDGDGYGKKVNYVIAATAPSGYVDNKLDCKDSDPDIHPGAPELCNAIDDDCDNQIDEDAVIAAITPSEDFEECNAEKVTFSSNTGSGFTYQWILNSIPIAGATKSTYKSKGQESGIYQVEVSDSLGCSSTSAEVTLTRIEKPKAVITPLDDLDICSTGSCELKAKDGTGILWQWKKNNVNINGATNQKYTATSAGNYTVFVTNPSGCTKLSASVGVFSSCKILQDEGIDSWLRYFPNPANDHVQIQLRLNESIAGNLSVEVYNVIGSAVKKEMLSVDGATINHKLSLSGLADGTYFLRLALSGETRIVPLVISKINELE